MLQVARRTLGLRRKDAVQEATDAVLDASNPFLTEANAERIVNTLCKVVLHVQSFLNIDSSFPFADTPDSKCRT